MKGLEKRAKKMDVWGIGLLKWGMVALTLFLVTVWPALHDLVMRAHWGWFLGAAVLLLIKPFKNFWLCCK